MVDLLVKTVAEFRITLDCFFAVYSVVLTNLSLFLTACTPKCKQNKINITQLYI